MAIHTMQIASLSETWRGMMAWHVMWIVHSFQTRCAVWYDCFLCVAGQANSSNQSVTLFVCLVHITLQRCHAACLSACPFSMSCCMPFSMFDNACMYMIHVVLHALKSLPELFNDACLSAGLTMFACTWYMSCCMCMIHVVLHVHDTCRVAFSCL